MMLFTYGELSERFKEPVLKTGDSERNLGFESLTLRQIKIRKSTLDGWTFLLNYVPISAKSVLHIIDLLENNAIITLIV